LRTRRVRKNSSARLDNGDQRGSTATPLRTLLCQTGAPYPNCPVPSPSVCDLLWRSVWAVWGSCWSCTCCAKQTEWCTRSRVAPSTQGMYTPRACARRNSNSGQRHWHVTVRSWQRFCCPRPPTIPAPSVCTSWRKDSRTGGRTAPSSSRLSSTWLAHLSIERNEPPHHHVHVRTRARALCPTR